MKTIAMLLLSAFLLIVVGGCQTTGGERQTRYPAEIEGIGESPNYPLKAAGFDRAEIMTYAPGMTNISTAYNHLAPEAQIAATIYVYKKGGSEVSVNQQYEAEKTNIEKYHPGAKLLKEGEEMFIKNGKELTALKAQYEFDGVFMHKPQKVYSELILIEHEGKYIKLRSTAPRDHKEIIKMLRLIRTLS